MGVFGGGGGGLSEPRSPFDNRHIHINDRLWVSGEVRVRRGEGGAVIGHCGWGNEGTLQKMPKFTILNLCGDETKWFVVGSFSTQLGSISRNS